MVVDPARNGHSPAKAKKPRGRPPGRKVDKRTLDKLNRAIARVPSSSLDHSLAVSNERGETNKAHAAFMIFCDLGPHRTLPMLCRELGKAPGYVRMLHYWSGKYGWQARAKEFDRDKFEETKRKQEMAIIAMNDMQVGIARYQQRKMIAHIERLISSGKLSAMATVTHLKNMLELERTALGAPTERTSLALTGEDGGPVQMEMEATSRVLLYLPKKQESPGDRDGSYGQEEPAS
jgi:hypothetical protein